MSDTPRTEENQRTWDRSNEAGVSADFARDLERELNAAQARIAELEKRLHSSERARQSLSDACDSLQAEIRQLKAAPTPLPRPDKPGWWWLWTNEGTPPRWLPVYVSMPEASKDGQWLPATPPPAPKNEEGQG